MTEMKTDLELEETCRKALHDYANSLYGGLQMDVAQAQRLMNRGTPGSDVILATMEHRHFCEVQELLESIRQRLKAIKDAA
jgi:hypothetical protein